MKPFTRQALLGLAAGAALALAGCATTQETAGPGETTGQYVDDATVTAKVKTAIATDVGIKAATNVNVETSHGVVQLSGFADSGDQASRAVDAAKKIAGVRSVRNDIRVKSGS
ncbi:MAG: BON domain-containing protein [Clostridia bacterium]